MKNLLLASAAALSMTAVALPGPANAATIVVNHVFDPANVGAPFIQETLAAPFSMQAGDTLDLTYTFLGGATVSLANESYIWQLVFADMSAVLQTTGSLEFLGASANVISGMIPLSQQNANVHIGSQYASGLYRLDANPISFTGLRQIITIDSDDLGTPREYSNLSLATDGDVSITAGAVPEPATWAFMIFGFGAIGGAMRRRRNVNVKVSYA